MAVAKIYFIFEAMETAVSVAAFNFNAKITKQLHAEASIATSIGYISIKIKLIRLLS